MLEYLESPGRFSLGRDAFLGKWRVGWFGYDGSHPKGDPKKYKSTCYLPGIKAHLGNFETEEEAREQLAKAVDAWLKGARVVPVELQSH